jgi:hypothetical protein
VPIILVGNKIDTRGADMNNPQLENEFQPLLNQYKELETVIECSAKEMLNVNEVFFFAQKVTAILFFLMCCVTVFLKVSFLLLGLFLALLFSLLLSLSLSLPLARWHLLSPSLLF